MDMKDLTELEAVAAELAEVELRAEGLRAKRDKLIVRARKDGFAWTRLEAATKLSRQGIAYVAKAANKGVLPVPRQRG